MNWAKSGVAERSRGGGKGGSMISSRAKACSVMLWLVVLVVVFLGVSGCWSGASGVTSVGSR